MSLRLAVVFAATAICCHSLSSSAALLGSAGIAAGTGDERPLLHVASPTVVYAVGRDFVRGLDLTDPANPGEFFRRTRNDPDFFTQVVDLGGGFFYGRNSALPNEWGLFDASDPTNPQLVAAIPLDLMALGGWVEGNSLLLVTEDPAFDFSQRLVELSIVDPLNPVVIAEQSLYGGFEFVSSVVRKGDRLFVVGGDYIVDDQYQHYLRHYDLAAWPAAPSQVERVSLGGFLQTRAAALVEDPDGIVAAAHSGVLVRIHQKNNGSWETNSYSASEMGSTEIAGGFRDANGDLHLLGVRPSTGVDPVAIYSYNNNGTLNFECNSSMSAHAPEDYLLGPVLAGSAYVLPFELGTIRTGSYDCVGGYVQHAELPTIKLTTFETAELAQGHAYVGGTGQVDVYDMADPLDPVYLRSLAVPFTVDEFERYDPTTLIAWDRQDQLAVLDLSDPANPSVLATPVLPPAAASPKLGSSGPRLRCSPPYFVVVENVAGMTTLCEISVYEFAGFGSITAHATLPVPSATPSLDDFPRAVTVHGMTAYIAQSTDTHIIDFSTPSSPTIALVMPDVGFNVATANGALFVHAGNPLYATRVYDLTDPLNPAWLLDLDESGKLLPMDDWLLVRNSNSSVALYDVSQPSAPQLLDANCAMSRWPNDPFLPSGDGLAIAGISPSSAASWVQIYAFDAPTPAPEPGGGVIPIAVMASPNPSSGRVRFSWRAVDASAQTLSVYDLRGRLMTTLVEGRRGAGLQQFDWTGTDRHGRPVASGIYFVRFASETASVTQKFVLLR